MQKSKELIEYSVADAGERGSHSRLKVGARLRWAEREGLNSVPRGATQFPQYPEGTQGCLCIWEEH